jgi:hypothetical protein
MVKTDTKGGSKAKKERRRKGKDMTTNLSYQESGRVVYPGACAAVDGKCEREPGGDGDGGGDEGRWGWHKAGGTGPRRDNTAAPPICMSGVTSINAKLSNRLIRRPFTVLDSLFGGTTIPSSPSIAVYVLVADMNGWTQTEYWFLMNPAARSAALSWR